MALVITKEDAELLHQVNMAVQDHHHHNAPLTISLNDDQVLEALKILVAMWRHLG